ncbi:hypothetical protein FE374_01185 [Georgenia yuyongxinii]|uniref:Uncharacterized protein n=1 Tax=Georgenia yuyongxinii TaxID=2589797 RepID=A0A5B8BYM1_9MICO|nr:hypothetical protein [Georgenia yuyongxinii]QDC23424.1 hypothetical protein FE374_01185 [Georgenia yuyongxinii]
MRLYADLPARRVRQVTGDVLVLVWLGLCVAAGAAVRGAIAVVAGPLRQVAEVGGGIEANMTSASATAGGVPLVGDRLAGPFDGVAVAGERLQRAGLDGAGLVETLAVVVGVLLTTLPALVVLVPWLVARLRFVRRADEVRRLAADPAGLDLLALRALAHRPPAMLAATAGAPARAWRDGDPKATRRLAGLELARWGVAPPRDADG